MACGALGLGVVGLLFRGMSLLDRQARREAEQARARAADVPFTYHPPE